MYTEKNPSITYYSEFQTSDGHKHYCVNVYNTLSHWIWSLKDYKFPDHDYSESKAFDQFVVDEAGHGTYIVIDQSDDSIVGKFFTRDDACKYAEYKNKYMIW